MRKRDVPPPWQGRDEQVAGHIQPDDAFAGLTEADQPPAPVAEDGHERLARFVDGAAQASANLAALADGIGRRRNAVRARRSATGGRNGSGHGPGPARATRATRGVRAPNLARALEAAIAAEPDHWGPHRLHVSDTRHALKGEGCPRQLWLRVHGAAMRERTLGERLLLDHGTRIHERVARLIDAGLEDTAWRVRAIERRVTRELETSGLGIERGRFDLELEHEDGMRLILDMKTQRGHAFRHLEAPKRPHVVQLQTYMMLRDADAGLLLYVDREGQNAVRQFHVQRDDATVQRAARVITKIASRRDPPEPLVGGPRGGKPWQCGYCNYYGASCSGPTRGPVPIRKRRTRSD